MGECIQPNLKYPYQWWHYIQKIFKMPFTMLTRLFGFCVNLRNFHWVNLKLICTIYFTHKLGGFANSESVKNITDDDFLMQIELNSLILMVSCMNFESAQSCYLLLPSIYKRFPHVVPLCTLSRLLSAQEILFYLPSL